MSKITESSAHDATAENFDKPVALTCPDCGGALRESNDGATLKFTCHIGHVYDSKTMPVAQFDDMNNILSAAVRCLNERASLCEILANYDPSGSPILSAKWDAARQQAQERAYQLRDFIEQGWLTPETKPSEK